MANDLGIYNPTFYAQEALVQLEKVLGMAGTVYRGFEEERNTRRVGDTISIRRPSTFVAQDAPSTAQDLDPDTVNMTLSFWKEVKFKLTDKELAISEERIIEDHIRPAAVAIADDIDMRLSGLYADIPWFTDVSGTPAVGDLIAARRVLFDNKVPLRDQEMIYGMVDGAQEEAMLGFPIFHQANTDARVTTQVDGMLGRRFGVNWFANQNVKSHTAGVSVDATGAINNVAGYAKGSTSIAIDGVTTAGTFKAGDTLVIAGNSQRYAITADATAAGGAVTLAITPPLVAAVSDNDVVTIELDDHTANMVYHRNAFALAMAPLPDSIPNDLGARVTTVDDPITNLSLRSRLYYVGDASEVHVALDVLYGVKTLDPNLGTRLRGA